MLLLMLLLDSLLVLTLVLVSELPLSSSSLLESSSLLVSLSDGSSPPSGNFEFSNFDFESNSFNALSLLDLTNSLSLLKLLPDNLL